MGATAGAGLGRVSAVPGVWRALQQSRLQRRSCRGNRRNFCSDLCAGAQFTEAELRDLAALKW